jgi:hypothetical protein
MGFAGFDDFEAARDQLSFFVEEVVVRVLQLRVVFVVGLDAAAEAFALDVVARAPSRQENHLAAELGAGIDDTGIRSTGRAVERDARPQGHFARYGGQDIRHDVDGRPPVRLQDDAAHAHGPRPWAAKEIPARACVPWRRIRSRYGNGHRSRLPSCRRKGSRCYSGRIFKRRIYRKERKGRRKILVDFVFRLLKKA